uniref:Uncharacterized protein n=1 Tax=Anopheles dirus TaxID=7168 RepID=A0A182NBB3_9DIPT
MECKCFYLPVWLLIGAVCVVFLVRHTTYSNADLPSVGKFMAGPRLLHAVSEAKQRPLLLQLAEDRDGAECDRICTHNEAPRVCYFHWIAENYAAMGSACGDCRWGNRSHCFHPQCVTADGMERGVLAINRRIPGPAIHVCQNDLVVVDLENHMEGLESTIHWHGAHQYETPWMDGVPMITQCPIPHGTTFRYAFNASEPGTQLYHSHSGHQKANGHYGLFVVRSATDINRHLYDYDLTEHHIVISDWTLDMVEKFVPGLQSSTVRMDSILINGRGRHYDIENHRMQLISTDGSAVRPTMIDTLISTSGERYDFVLSANQKPGTYWVRVRAIGFCNVERREEFAVLSYTDETDSVPEEELAYPQRNPPTWDERFPSGTVLNNPNATCYVPGDDDLCVADLESHELYRDDDLIDATPDKTFRVLFNTFTADPAILFSGDGYVRYMTVVLTLNNIGVTNNISMVFPDFPLLTQPELIGGDGMFCNDTHRPAHCRPHHACFCLHRLKVALNDVVEMALIDDAEVVRDLYHPFHLHGHRFIVTGMGQLPVFRTQGEKVRFVEGSRRYARTMPSDHNPPYKDTVSVPSRGYTRIRFRADNPGFWLVHCHFEWHLGIGMSFVLQVGEVDQMKRAPRDFPRFLLSVSSSSAEDWLRALVKSSNGTLDVRSFPGEQCLRQCDKTHPRICHFSWTMEHYHVMGPACRDCARGNHADCYHPACITADGFERGVMSLNRRIPGPTISVCHNDLIVVDVTNAMGGTAATIHWHGLHQRATPHMDGVPFITQCPIAFGDTFRYAFLATEPGTQFYHSHSGHHKVNGHYGALIVREPIDADPNGERYHYDTPAHVIVASDWMHIDGEMFMPGLPSAGGIMPVNLLINGRGTFFDRETNETVPVPLEVFTVRRGARFRFRFINAASHVCPLQVQIEDHTMEIIASDSFHLQPHKVDTLVTTSGERYDFVVDANGARDRYWIRIRALGPCAERQLEQFAVLRYTTGPKENDAFPTKVPPAFDNQFPSVATANHPNATCGQAEFGDYCITDFQAYDTDESVIHGTPDHQLKFGFSNYPVDFRNMFETHPYEHFMNIHGSVMLQGAINNLSLSYPPFPLLTQREQIDESMFCDERSRPERCADEQLCSCTHRVQIKLGELVELYILDLTPSVNDLNHPFHLHGYQMFVMEMGQDRRVPITMEIAEQIAHQRLRQRSLIPLPPRKDTISIPSRGYARVRFRADNPGFWLMHCHYEWHTAVGMALVLQVGETDEMVKPPADFPKCGSYTPPLDTLLQEGL